MCFGCPKERSHERVLLRPTSYVLVENLGKQIQYALFHLSDGLKSTVVFVWLFIKFSKISNTLLFLFSNKIVVFRADLGLH